MMRRPLYEGSLKIKDVYQSHQIPDNLLTDHEFVGDTACPLAEQIEKMNTHLGRLIRARDDSEYRKKIMEAAQVLIAKWDTTGIPNGWYRCEWERILSSQDSIEAAIAYFSRDVGTSGLWGMVQCSPFVTPKE